MEAAKAQNWAVEPQEKRRNRKKLATPGIELNCVIKQRDNFTVD
jgi:hypothetical protein